MVAAAGDVNADGLADFMVGCPGCDLTSSGDEGAVLLFTGDKPFTSTALDGHVTLYGADTSDELGTHAASAGDYDGDGYDDLLLGTGDSGTYSDWTFLYLSGI